MVFISLFRLGVGDGWISRDGREMEVLGRKKRVERYTGRRRICGIDEGKQSQKKHLTGYTPSSPYCLPADLDYCQNAWMVGIFEYWQLLAFFLD